MKKKRILSVIEKTGVAHPRTPKRKDALVVENKVISLEERAKDKG